MDTLLCLDFLEFSAFPSGTVYKILKNSYSLYPTLSIKDSEWLRLDTDIYSDRTSDLEGFIAAVQNEPIGVILWQLDKDGENAILLECSVSLLHQRKGYGSLMMQEAINRLASMGVKSIFAKTYQRLEYATRLLDKHNFAFVRLCRDNDLSLCLGVGVNYQHIIGKKLPRPKKLRKKWKIF